MKLDLPLGARSVQGDVWSLAPIENLTIYFIDQPEFYFRHSPYLQPDGISYPDNDERFIFFSKASCIWRAQVLKPELVHVHDWQAGFVPLLMRHQKLAAKWANPPPTCLTIHNLAYQGMFPAWRYMFTNLPSDYFNSDGVEFYGQMNCLKAGIAFADLRHDGQPALCARNHHAGIGLRAGRLAAQAAEGPVRNSQRRGLRGMEHDAQSVLSRIRYSAEDLSGKTANKLELQKELGLPVDERIPLFGSITRLAEQKGVDIQLGALGGNAERDMQFVVLGSGDATFTRQPIGPRARVIPPRSPCTSVSTRACRIASRPAAIFS